MPTRSVTPGQVAASGVAARRPALLRRSRPTPAAACSRRRLSEGKSGCHADRDRNQTRHESERRKRVCICGMRRCPAPGGPLPCGNHECLALRRTPATPEHPPRLPPSMPRRAGAPVRPSSPPPRPTTTAAAPFRARTSRHCSAHGLIGLVAPAEHGGGGATLATARRVISAVARGEPATALILTMTYLQHHAIAACDSRWPRASARTRRARRSAQTAR